MEAAKEKYIEEHEGEILDHAAERYKDEHEKDASFRRKAARLLAEEM